MSSLTDLSDLLRETYAVIAQTEHAVALEPASFAVAASMGSLRKRARQIEESFNDEAANLGVDKCSYRLFGGNTFTINTLTHTLAGFQELLTEVHSVLTTGKKRNRGRVPLAVVEETQLQLGYTFSGSLGLVFTLPHNRPLLGESMLDASVSTVFLMAGATDPAMVKDFATLLGPAPVRALYRWSGAHRLAGLGADIRWERKEHEPLRLFLQEKEMARLHETIEATADEYKQESVTLSGMLIGIDTRRRSFRAVFDDGTTMSGTVGLGMTPENPAHVPARYNLKLTKRTRTKYAAAADEVSWVLNDLELV